MLKEIAERKIRKAVSIDSLEARRLFAGPPVAFNAAAYLPTQSDATNVLTADMNNDGKLDVVTLGTANSFSPARVAILLGNGNGTFQSPSQSFDFVPPVSSGAFSANGAIGDINRDGRTDIVLVRRDDAAVYVAYGNGNGTVGSPVRFGMPATASFGPSAVAIGDVQGDQWPDVIVGRFDQPKVAILNGGSTFSATSNVITLPSGNGGLLAVADFDGSGSADIAISATGGITIIRGLNQASPSFVQHGNLWPGMIPDKLVVGRLLGPGNLPGLSASAFDLGGQGRVVRIPSPTSATPGIVFAGVSGLPRLSEGDFNRDGFSDVMIVSGSAAQYFTSTGTSTGGLDVDPTARALARASSSVDSGDFNNDGYLDFVAAFGDGGAAVYTQIPESLTVTTAADEDDGTASPGVGAGTSLREAVGYAARLGGGTITFASALGNANAVINLTRGIMPTGFIGSPSFTIRNDTGRITIDGSGNGSRPFVSFFGSLTVQNLTFRNFSYGNSGAVFFVGAFSPGLTIDSCTFTGNTASGQGSVVYAEDLAPVTIRNSTFTGNGGNNLIACNGWSNGQYITLQNNTIYGNTASGVASLRGNVYLQNNIIANNGTADVVYAGGGFVGSNNIIRTGGGPAGSVNVDPLLGALANNGGRTFTMLPAPNSPAINAAAAIGLTADQRGTARPQGASPDIGAVERVATSAQLTGASFEYLTRQAVNLTFSGEASVSFSRANLTLTNLTTNQVITAGTLNWNPTGTTASLVLTNLLADGNYRMQSGGTTLDFSVLAGDVNRDRTVTFDDLLVVAQNFDQPGDASTGDVNYDGTVNFDDLLLLSQRFNTSLLTLSSQTARPAQHRTAKSKVLG